MPQGLRLTTARVLLVAAGVLVPAVAIALAVVLHLFASVPSSGPASARRTESGRSSIDVVPDMGARPGAVVDRPGSAPEDDTLLEMEAEIAAGMRGPADAPVNQEITEHSRAEPGAPTGVARHALKDPAGDASRDRRAVQQTAASERTSDRPPSSADDGKTGAAADLSRSADQRKRGIEQFGGSVQTEGAVEAGLSWLAAHQSPDGSWDRHGFTQLCPSEDRCGGQATSRNNHSLRAGVTGLSLLAFLGAGYTPKTGEYQKQTAAAVAALLALQQDHGGFSESDGMAGYNDSLATLALAECYHMTADPRLEQPLRRAVLRLAHGQQPLGGWDYLPDPRNARNDTSITAWVVQALQACAAAGIPVPRKTMVGAAMHFGRAAQAGGKIWYSDSGEGFFLDSSQRPLYRYGPAMSACGLVSERLLGWRSDAGVLRDQHALLLANLPASNLARGKDRTGLHSEYYWYYGTLAMFQEGGQSWERWNARLRDHILPLQNREKMANGRKRHAFGSWQPYGEGWGKWGRMGSRVYTTAICTLTLEIYYRHTPAYLSEQVAVTAEQWRDYLREADPRTLLRAIRVLRDCRLEIGEPVLFDLLKYADPEVSIAAAVALAGIDSPAGFSILDEVVSRLPPWERGNVEKALARIAEIRSLPVPGGAVRLFDPATGLATLHLTRAWVGMNLLITREGGEVARMRVIQRWTGRPVVVAQLTAGRPPAEGDLAQAESD